MGEVVYKYIPRPNGSEEAIEFLKNEFTPMIHEYWQAKGQGRYRRDLDINILALSQMYLGGALVIIMAYRDDKPVGIMVGVRFAPIFFDARAYQIEAIYGRDMEIEEGLYNYLKECAPLWELTDIVTFDEPRGDQFIDAKKNFAYTLTWHRLE